MTTEWTGDEYLRALQDQCKANITEAIIHYAAKVQDKISRDQPRKRYSGKYVSYKGEDPSSPGEPPKMLSAELIRSISWDVDSDGLGGRVGAGMKYALPLEFGTIHMAARPFFRPTLEEETERLYQILSQLPST